MEALGSLGIDLRGVLLYAVNFGLLIVILTKFLYKPVLKYIDERRANIKGNLEETEKLRMQFEKETKTLTKEKEEALRRMQEELFEAKRSGEQKSKAIISEAEQRRDQLLEDARILIQDMKSRVNEEVEDDVKKRMTATLKAVLKDMPEAEVKKSIDAAWKEINI